MKRTLIYLMVLESLAAFADVRPEGADALRQAFPVAPNRGTTAGRTLLTGDVAGSTLRPSSDTPTHLELYRAFDCGAVVHTHSEFATMFAQVRMGIRCMGTTHADYFRGDIPVTRPLRPEEVDQDYERNTGLVIVETFRERGVDAREIPAVLVANHGPFTWGADAAKAVEHARVLEYLARLEWRGRLVAPDAARPDQFLIDKHYLRKHGPRAYYGQ